MLDLVEFRWVMLVPLYCTVSVLWSDAPGTTLRAGIQLILTSSSPSPWPAACRRAGS
jgi:hypothetical protein